MGWYLKEVLLSGFKSFHRRTRVQFPTGLTAIVGSNGCGKTNLADAIRFAMGEIRPHQLRVDTLEDVIFSGTATQPPLSVTEVTLELAESGTNNSFTITRRLTRNGESEYRIDGQLSRLKDVQRKLEQIGISSHRGVVVELRQMEEVLYEGSKLPRQLVEEGCGLTPFLERKSQSELKLQTALSQLEKLVPRIEQMKEELLKLQEQAQKAKRWKRIKEALDYAKNNELWAEVRQLRNDLKAVQEELQQLEQNASIQLELETLQSKIDALEETSTQLEATWTDLTNQLLSLNRSREEAQHRQNKLEMERVRLETRTQNLTDEKNQLEKEYETILVDPTTTLYDDLKTSKSTLSSLNTQLQQKESLFQQYEKIVQDQEKQLQIYQTKKELLTSRIKLFQNEFESYLTSLQNLPPKKEFDSSNLHTFENEFNTLVEAETHLFHSQKEATENYQKIQLELETLTKQLEDYRKNIEEARNAYFHTKRQLDERLDIHQTLRQLLEPYLTEIEIFRDHQDETALLHFRISGTDRILVPTKHLESILKLALKNEVRCEWITKYPKVKIVPLQKLLSETPPPNEEWFAIEGISQNASGVFRTAGALDPSVPIGLPQKVQQLLTKYQTLEKEYEQLNELFLQKKAIYTKTQEKLSEIQKATNDLTQKKQALEQSIFLEKQKQIAIEKENQFLESEQKRLNELITSAEDRIRSTQDELHQLSVPEVQIPPKLLEDTKKEIEQLKTEIRKNENAVHHIELSLRTYEMNLEIRRNRRSAIQLRLQDIESELQTISQAHLELQKSFQKNKDELQKFVTEEATLQKERSAHQVLRTQALNELKELRNQYEVKRKEYEQYVTQKAILGEKIHSLQSTLSQKTKEAEESGPEPKETTKIGFDEIQRLMKRLESLEPVNHLAEVQFESLQQQLRELETESDEIQKAAEIHRKSVMEAEKHAIELLTISRVRIQDIFSDILSRLFPGGEASLDWGEGDILTNAPLLLHASPRGKKIRSLRVLSGGERALVALAFLVAVLTQQKPLPYLILDEVDAPLDEENTIRFLNWIRELTKHTQVLLLTHNRQSIASSNFWIGVTMPEPGISQVVRVIPQVEEQIQ